MNLFLGMAGIPPFLGFFSKILIISSLLFYENYYLFLLFFISSLIIAFYYIQNYRFFGVNLKNTNFLKQN
jgi:NADH:ubiquinone oxidoreductase subunit 2 (subunit N)